MLAGQPRHRGTFAVRRFAMGELQPHAEMAPWHGGAPRSFSQVLTRNQAARARCWVMNSNKQFAPRESARVTYQAYTDPCTSGFDDRTPREISLWVPPCPVGTSRQPGRAAATPTTTAHNLECVAADPCFVGNVADARCSHVTPNRLNGKTFLISKRQGGGCTDRPHTDGKTFCDDVCLSTLGVQLNQTTAGGLTATWFRGTYTPLYTAWGTRRTFAPGTFHGGSASRIMGPCLCHPVPPQPLGVLRTDLRVRWPYGGVWGGSRAALNASDSEVLNLSGELPTLEEPRHDCKVLLEAANVSLSDGGGATDARWIKFQKATMKLKHADTCDKFDTHTAPWYYRACEAHVGFKVEFFNNVLFLKPIAGKLRDGRDCTHSVIPVGLARQGRRGLFKVTIDPLVSYATRPIVLLLTSDGGWRMTTPNEDGSTCNIDATVVPALDAEGFANSPPFQASEPSSDCLAADGQIFYPVSRDGSECHLSEAAGVSLMSNECASLCIFAHGCVCPSSPPSHTHTPC